MNKKTADKIRRNFRATMADLQDGVMSARTDSHKINLAFIKARTELTDGLAQAEKTTDSLMVRVADSKWTLTAVAVVAACVGVWYLLHTVMI